MDFDLRYVRKRVGFVGREPSEPGRISRRTSGMEVVERMNSAQVHNTLAMLVQTYGDLLLAEKLRGDAEKARAERLEREVEVLRGEWKADRESLVVELNKAKRLDEAEKAAQVPFKMSQQ